MTTRRPKQERYSRIEQRLIEYGEWLNQPRFDAPMGQSVFGRIRDEQENAGAHGEGLKPDIIDGVPCRPDGGLGNLADRLGREIARDNRCRDIADLLAYLPAHHRTVFDATYLAPPRDIPRSERSAARLLGITRDLYGERHAALIGWFEGAMFRAMFYEEHASSSNATATEVPKNAA